LTNQLILTNDIIDQSLESRMKWKINNYFDKNVIAIQNKNKTDTVRIYAPEK